MNGKYYALTDGNEVCRTAIGMSCILDLSTIYYGLTIRRDGAMCSDKKSGWFDKNPEERLEDRASSDSVRRKHMRHSCCPQGASINTPRIIWDTTNSDDEDSAIQDPDSIDAYPDSPSVPKAEVRAGDALKYWENCQDTRPQLALDFLSAPCILTWSLALWHLLTCFCSILSGRRARVFRRPSAGQPSTTTYWLAEIQSSNPSRIVVWHTTNPRLQGPYRYDKE